MHLHDVQALSKWMESLGHDNSVLDRATKRERELTDHVYTTLQKHTIWHDELSRQCATHCPEVAR